MESSKLLFAWLSDSWDDDDSFMSLERKFIMLCTR